VHGFVGHLDAAEVVAVELARELVVVARHKDHTAALAGATQQLLDHVVVSLRPVPFATQLPAINDVSHQVEGLAGVVLEEFEQRSGLASRGAQVQVGNENGPKAGPFTTLTRAIVVAGALSVHVGQGTAELALPGRQCRPLGGRAKRGGGCHVRPPENACGNGPADR